MSVRVDGSAEGLRALHASLLDLRASAPLERRLDVWIDLLERDLLPRTAGGHDHLVAGIVGPNNAGKSALFNALVAGQGAGAPPTLSPSLPTGGATRRLV
ncbi:MAG: hypothetical protein AAGG01_19345, partial [Planctomycetota bacterium]